MTAAQASASLESTLRAGIKKLRGAELQSGHACMQIDNLPEDNCSIQCLSAWFDELISAAMKQSLALEKHSRHRFGSHTESAIKKENATLDRKLKKQNSISRQEYDQQYRRLNDNLQQLLKMVDELSDNSLQNARRISRYHLEIKRIEGLLHALQKKTIVELQAAEPSDITNPTEPIKPTSSMKPTDSTEPATPTNTTDSQSSAGSPDKTEHRPDLTDSAGLNKTLERCHKNRKDHKTAKKTAEGVPDNRGSIEKQQYGSEEKIRLTPVCHGYAVDPDSGECIKVWEIEKRRRIRNVLHESISALNTVEASVMTFHGKNGEAFEIHPSTAVELVVRDSQGNIVASLDQDLILGPDSAASEKEKNRLCDRYHYSDTVRKILTVYKGELVLSPTEFLSHPRSIYGMRPMFVGNALSEQHALKLMLDYLVMKSSKSALASRNQLISDGRYFSRQYIVEFITSMSRCFSPLAQMIRQELFKKCRVWHNDESTAKVIELLQDENGQKRSKNYIWTLVTGRHEQKQGVVYLGSRSRSVDDFIKQFKDAENLEPQDFAIEALVTDCYSGYSPGIDILEEMLDGRHIVHAACFFHLRKYFMEALALLKLDKVFRSICSCKPDDYNECLNRELKEQNLTAGENGRLLMFLTFLIELILRLDSDFAYVSKAELEERRQTYSKKLLDQFYSECSSLLRITPTMHSYVNTRGRLSVEGGSEYPWGKALAYALNNREELYSFINNGDIECTNNAAERQIRPCVIHRGIMQFLNKADTFRGYMDIMTITQTCRLNNINPYVYFQWVTDSAKMRIEQYRLSGEHEGTAQICRMPRSQNDKDGKRLSMYDEKYNCAFDKISFNGLDPWSYMEILNKEKQRRKR